MRRPTIFSFLIVIIVYGLIILAPGAKAWETRIDDNAGYGTKVVVDSNGDVIAVGTVAYGSDVVKLSKETGSVIWRYEVMGHESRNYAQDIAIDSRGDVFVVFAWTRAVVKVSGTFGTQIWSKPIGGTLNALLPIINAVAVDRNDDVITAGTLGGYFNVCKLDGGSGDEKWHYDERGGAAYGVAVDGNGDVAAVGVMSNDFATVKLRGTDGHELWQRVINGPGNFTDVFEEARAVAVGADGSVVAAGVTVNVTGEFNDCTKEFTVVKYDTNGLRKWDRVINGSLIGTDDRGKLHNGASDEANAVAIDSAGDVIAAGSFQLSPDVNVSAPERFQVFKFSGSNGNTIWDSDAEDTPPNEIASFGRAHAVSVDAQDNVVAAGVNDTRFAVVKFAGNNGSRRWPPRQPFQVSTIARDVITDAENNIVVTGESLGPEGLSRFTVIKLWGTDGTDYFADPTPTPPVPETVLKYAPLVYLHPDEEYRPGNPTTFINNSSLNWFHEGGCNLDVVAARGTVQASRLGADSVTPYTDHPIFPTINGISCITIPEIEFKAGDYTRPWDGNKRSSLENNFFWGNSFYEKEGFYLDLVDDELVRQGNPSEDGDDFYPGAPVFYEYVPHQYVTYWFFYPYNRFPVTSAAPDQTHEGDWERISISLDGNDDPVYVHYYRHKRGEYLRWTQTQREGDHVIVFSAKGSHASYAVASGPLAGFPTDAPEFLGIDHTDYGPKWRTWESLSDVKTQPWYGYGGAWGRVSTVPEIKTLLGSISGAEYTGPLGPSVYKNSVETWFKKIEGRVTDAKGNGFYGVTVNLSDSRGIVLDTIPTTVDGHYSFDRLTFGGSYAVFPTKQGYSFSPVIETFTDLRENQTLNFIAQDLIPPVLNLPANITVNADTPQGATVHFSVTATDNISINPRVSCRPPSGAVFPIGTTVVNCTATDDSGNVADGSFKVMVRGASEQMTDLFSLIRQFNLKKGTEQKLTQDLEQIQKALGQGDIRKACRDLGQFADKVRQETGKGITAEQGTRLIMAATRIGDVISCR